jgi:hypothetical protein
MTHQHSRTRLSTKSALHRVPPEIAAPITERERQQPPRKPAHPVASPHPHTHLQTLKSKIRPRPTSASPTNLRQRPTGNSSAQLDLSASVVQSRPRNPPGLRPAAHPPKPASTPTHPATPSTVPSRPHPPPLTPSAARVLQ